MKTPAKFKNLHVCLDGDLPSMKYMNWALRFNSKNFFCYLAPSPEERHKMTFQRLVNFLNENPQFNSDMNENVLQELAVAVFGTYSDERIDLLQQDIFNYDLTKPIENIYAVEEDSMDDLNWNSLMNVSSKIILIILPQNIFLTKVMARKVDFADE